jgi:hypothetical protein
MRLHGRRRRKDDLERKTGYSHGSITPQITFRIEVAA